MGDNVQRRRPPLRGDRERMENCRTPEHVEDVHEGEQQSDADFTLDSSVLRSLLDNKSMKGNVQEVLRKVVDYFEHLNTPQKRRFLTTTFILSLESRECSNVIAALYGLMHTIRVEDETVRSLLLTTIQKELEVNDYQYGNRPRFLNAVSLLSEMYYQIRFDDHPISILGGELIKYFRWLLSGKEDELEVLATGLMVNGEVLKKDKPASYRKLLIDVRKALVSRTLSVLSRSFLLLIVDMDNSNFKPLPEELLIYHVTYIGDEIFQRFKRLRPSLTASADDMTATSSVWEEYCVRQPSPVRSRSTETATSPERPHSPEQWHSPERQRSPEPRQSSERRHSPERQHSLEKRLPTEKRNSQAVQRSSDEPRATTSRDQRSSDEPRATTSRDQPSSSDLRPPSEASTYDSSKISFRVGQRWCESPVRTQRTEGYSRGRVFQNSSSSSNSNNSGAWTRNDRRTDPPTTGYENVRNERKSSWRNEHDDRFDRDYGY